MSCPECFKGKVHGHLSPKGEITKVHGVDCYVTPPQATPTSSKSTIIYWTDAFGIDLVNNKVLADRYAEGTGMRVLAPNIFIGGPAPLAMMDAIEGVSEKVPMTNIYGQVKKMGSTYTMLSTLVPFMMRSGPAKCYDTALDFTRKVRSDLPAEAKLGVAGFCWGGFHSTRLAAEPKTEGSSEPLINAAFAAHPSALKTPSNILDAVRKFKTPYSLALGSNDVVLSPKAVEQAKGVLDTESKEVPGIGYTYEFKIYEDMVHGFAVRGDHEKAEVRENMEEAKDQAVSWFKKYL